MHTITISIILLSKRWLTFAVSAIALSLTSACGGGGGGASETVASNPVPAPVGVNIPPMPFATPTQTLTTAQLGTNTPVPAPVGVNIPPMPFATPTQTLTTAQLGTNTFVPLAAIGQDAGGSLLTAILASSGSSANTSGVPSTQELSAWYRFYADHSDSKDMLTSSGGTTLGQRLIAGGTRVSKYVNGSYSDDKDAATIETTLALGVQTFWCGNWSDSSGLDSSACRLPQSLNSGQTSVTVTLPNLPPDNSAALATWPFRPSTAMSSASSSRAKFVSWLRIDNEVLRIDAVGLPQESNGTRYVVLTVQRAVMGSSAATHSANSRVLTPIYIGAPGAGLGGSVSCPDPANTTTDGIRYALRVEQGAGFALGNVQGSLASKVQNVVVNRAPSYDTAFLDVSSAHFFNMTDAYCLRAVRPYNSRDVSPGQHHLLTASEYAADHKSKVQYLNTQFPSLKFAVNNWEPRGGDANVDVAGILDGFANAYNLEAWNLALSSSAIQSALDNGLQIIRGEGSALFMQKSSEMPAAIKDVAQLRRWIYGSFLLIWQPSLNSTRLPPMLMLDVGPTKPDPLYFWQLGAVSAAPVSLPSLGSSSGQLSQPIAGIYRRDFSAASVFVNTSASSKTIALTNGTWTEVAATTPPSSIVGSITIPAYDARILFKP